MLLVNQNFLHCTVELSGTWPVRDTPTVYGGPLTGLYELSQIHFHWGTDNNVGSEHTVANQTYVFFLFNYIRSLIVIMLSISHLLVTLWKCTWFIGRKLMET